MGKAGRDGSGIYRRYLTLTGLEGGAGSIDSCAKCDQCWQGCKVGRIWVRVGVMVMDGRQVYRVRVEGDGGPVKGAFLREGI